MRIAMNTVGHIATVVAAAAFAAGCGTGATPPAGATVVASPSPFDHEAVRADLDAAVETAGLPDGKTESGYSKTNGADAIDASARAKTAKDRKRIALAVRMAPCVVSWSSGVDEQAESRDQLEGLLAGVAARGWKESEPSKEVPVGENGTYFMATYQKRGWTLSARHTRVGSAERAAVTVTEDTCFARLTDEELALFEGE
ncbi:hypothetical protein [Streptomyces sp. NPDC002265]|uniref:hypothetical protein n=1 Tax=Streptomyces sp. NPDC002265 TaxID=3154415 RepID=UPI00332331C6